MGAASCGGASCHAAPAPRAEPPFLQEHATWSAIEPASGLPFDRHAYATNRLYEERSGVILAALAAREGAAAAGASAPESPRCLSCHGASTQALGGFEGGAPVALRRDLQGGRFAAEDGVSCDACHGPAERWIDAHAARGWAAKERARHGSAERLFAETGLYDTKDLALLARRCVRCHLAIDASLLAAGHPDIAPFELATHAQAMPPHWRDYGAAKEAAGLPGAGPFHTLRLWEAGQVAALEAAALETARRAREGGERGASTGRVREAAERALGHASVLRHAVRIAAPDSVAPLERAASELRDSAALAPETPAHLARARIPAAAEALARLAAPGAPLAAALAAHRPDAAAAQSLARALASEPAALESSRAAEQVALALYAVRHAQLEETRPAAIAPPSSDPALSAIVEAFGPLRGDAPHRDPSFRRALERAREALAR
jgi:hypothetical protein